MRFQNNTIKKGCHLPAKAAWQILKKRVIQIELIEVDQRDETLWQS